MNPKAASLDGQGARHSAPGAAPVLEALGLRKVYGEGIAQVVAVDSVSLALQAGEMVAVVGPSGSGKTTLLSMLGLLLVPTAGTMRLLGEPVDVGRESTLPRLRRRYIGFIFQSFNLLSALSALDNVGVALRLKGIAWARARRDAAAFLDRVGLADRMHSLPRDLSGGQRQRVAIARALAACPVLILADEPTGNLDSRSGLAVMELLRAEARERRVAVALVTHDTRILTIADRVLRLEDGRLVG